MEINQLKYYLGTGLKYYARNKKVEWELTIIDSAMSFEHITPMMFPLSALTEPVLEGGKIPIVELAKIAFDKIDGVILVDNFVSLGDGYSFHFSKNVDGVCFSCRRGYDGKRWDYSCFVPNQLDLFEQLFQWHFWPFDQSLFETGELIDKRLKQQ